MAYSFPMAIEDFFDSMPITSITMQLGEARQQSGVTGAGEILTANLGVRLWRGDVNFEPMYYDDADGIMALVSILEEPGSSFFVYNAARSDGPQADPDGSILGAAAPKISSINANNRDLTIKSLPAGYVLRPGDPMAWSYGSNPVRYAYHKVVQGGTADGSGNLTVELSPRIQSGATADTAITLIKPACKAIIVPGSFDSGTYGDGANTGAKFSWQQTLR